MYTPPAFQVTDPRILSAFLVEHPFATLVTQKGGHCHATHLPFLHQPGIESEQGRLWTHLARGNPQAEHLAGGGEALVIFQGPHAYVSPSWYATAPAVPTWNYTAVHAYGIPRLVCDPDGQAELLRRTVEAHEAGRPGRWEGRMPAGCFEAMVRGIVAVEIRITRLEGKFKLSQNRPVEDRLGVFHALEASTHPGDRACAAAMLAVGVLPSTDPRLPETREG